MAETHEERFWRRLAPGLFAPRPKPSVLARVINHVGVTPLAHVTFLNLDYQIYLNQIFHTAAGTWIGHVVCIPLNVGLLFYALAVYTGAAEWLLALLAVWYVSMAIRMRAPAWGLITLAVLGGLWALASRGAAWALAAGLPWYLEPLVLIVAVSVLQAYSHMFEANVPPRANFERHWMPAREFVWGNPEQLSLGRRLARLAWVPIGGVWGTFDEWMASAKLLPLYVLELLWLCGYQHDRRDAYRGRSLAALASGDPALDWVGSGGGSSVVELEQT